MITEGLETKKVDIMVTREKIRTYCDAIGEKNVIYESLKAARSAGYTDLVIPATYPTLFWQDIKIPWLSSQSSLIQSSQTFDYQEPLIANRTYTCFIKLAKVRKSGNKQFLQHELYITYHDKTVATSTTTLVGSMGTVLLLPSSTGEAQEAQEPSPRFPTITDDMVERYAAVSGDDNPIHLSKSAANQAGFPKKVAHGMLTMAISTRLVSPLLGKKRIIQSFTSKFLSPVYVNDQLTVTGFVLYHRDDVLCIKVQAQNQNGKMVMKGKVTLK